MKNSLLFVLLFAATLFAQSQPAYKNSDLEITKLNDRLWVVETTDKTCMYIVEGNNKALLIDTGTKCEKLPEVIRQITRKPLIVLITHIHGDHAGNMDQFSEVYFHAADTVLLGLGKPYRGKTHFVTDGQVFDLGGTKLEISHMPAHTPGSIVVLDRKAGNCFSGDAFGSGQVWLQLRPFSPIKTYISSLRKMEKLMDNGITKIYCGHYPYVKKAYDKSYITAMRELAQSLEAGTAKDAQEYPLKVSIGGDNPMIVSNGPASIVYDPNHLK